MPHTHDLLIVGHGLAGAVLAQECAVRGRRVHVYDTVRANSASAAAAGLVNPVVLRRDVLSWRAAELLPIASSFYQRMGQGLGVDIWHPVDLVKVFPTPKEVEQWERAMRHPDTAPFLSRSAVRDVDAAPIAAPHGYGKVSACAWAHVAVLLQAHRIRLQEEDALTEEAITPGMMTPINGGVRIGEHSAPWVVHCEGPFADLSGLVPVKGETLTVRIRGLQLTCGVHRGVFLLPLGDDLYRIGATFKWDNVWEGPTEEARTWLLAKLAAFIDADVEVLEHQAGVRPAARDRRPIIGPTSPHHAVFNGLGSRGVSLAPWCSGHLLDHLFDQRPLDAEVDVQRFKA